MLSMLAFTGYADHISPERRGRGRAQNVAINVRRRMRCSSDEHFFAYGCPRKDIGSTYPDK